MVFSNGTLDGVQCNGINVDIMRTKKRKGGRGEEDIDNNETNSNSQVESEKSSEEESENTGPSDGEKQTLKNSA
eukprot:7092520-Ditylum_brightwellii.AAC.1